MNNSTEELEGEVRKGIQPSAKQKKYQLENVKGSERGQDNSYVEAVRPAGLSF